MVLFDAQDWRWLLANLLAPWQRGAIVRALSGANTACSSEILQSYGIRRGMTKQILNNQCTIHTTAKSNSLNILARCICANYYGRAAQRRPTNKRNKRCSKCYIFCISCIINWRHLPPSDIPVIFPWTTTIAPYINAVKAANVIQSEVSNTIYTFDDVTHA